MLKMPEYHNPDPLVRLIGDANEAPAIVEGVPITSLVDSGASMSAMVKSFVSDPGPWFFCNPSPLTRYSQNGRYPPAWSHDASGGAGRGADTQS